MGLILNHMCAVVTCENKESLRPVALALPLSLCLSPFSHVLFLSLTFFYLCTV